MDEVLVFFGYFLMDNISPIVLPFPPGYNHSMAEHEIAAEFLLAFDPMEQSMVSVSFGKYAQVDFYNKVIEILSLYLCR